MPSVTILQRRMKKQDKNNTSRRTKRSQTGAGAILLFGVIAIVGMSALLYSSYKGNIQVTKSLSAVSDDMLHDLGHNAALNQAESFLNDNQSNVRPLGCGLNKNILCDNTPGDTYYHPNPAIQADPTAQDANWWGTNGITLNGTTTPPPSSTVITGLSDSPRYAITSTVNPTPNAVGSCDTLKHTYTYVIYTRVATPSKTTFRIKQVERTFLGSKSPFVFYTTSSSPDHFYFDLPVVVSFTVPAQTSNGINLSDGIITELWIARLGNKPWSATVLININSGERYPLTPLGQIVLFKPNVYSSFFEAGEANRGVLPIGVRVKQGETVSITLTNMQYSMGENGKCRCRYAGPSPTTCSPIMVVAGQPAWCDS